MPSVAAVALAMQSDANEKFNELEEQLQQIKDQIQVAVDTLACAQGVSFHSWLRWPTLN